MAVKFTAKERQAARDVEAVIDSFDTKQAVLVASAVISRIDTPKVIELICDVLDSIGTIYTGSATKMLEEALRREGMTVDIATDAISDLMEKAVLMGTIARLLARAVEPDDENGEHGLFTLDREHMNKSKEGVRKKLLHEKIEADLAKKRRGS